MEPVDWASFDVDQLAGDLRGKIAGRDGERMARAFEEAVRVARHDQDLLAYVLVAVVCLLARMDGSSPRGVLEAFFRHSVTDEEWRSTYRPLFG